MNKIESYDRDIELYDKKLKEEKKKNDFLVNNNASIEDVKKSDNLIKEYKNKCTELLLEKSKYTKEKIISELELRGWVVDKFVKYGIDNKVEKEYIKMKKLYKFIDNYVTVYIDNKLLEFRDFGEHRFQRTYINSFVNEDELELFNYYELLILSDRILNQEDEEEISKSIMENFFKEIKE